MSSEIGIDVQGVSKDFGHFRALDNVDAVLSGRPARDRVA